MFSKLFLKDLSERAVATAAQVLLGIFTAAQFNLLNADWKSILTVVVTAVVVVVLKAFVALKVGSTVSPASLAPNDKVK